MESEAIHGLNASVESLVAVNCSPRSSMEDDFLSPASSPSQVSRASSQHSVGQDPLPTISTLPMVAEVVGHELSLSDSRRWSSLMPDKMSFGRRKAVAELLGTEEHYLEDLKNLLEGYRQRMEGANVSWGGGWQR